MRVHRKHRPSLLHSRTLPTPLHSRTLHTLLRRNLLHIQTTPILLPWRGHRTRLPRCPILPRQPLLMLRAALLPSRSRRSRRTSSSRWSRRLARACSPAGGTCDERALKWGSGSGITRRAARANKGESAPAAGHQGQGEDTATEHTEAAGEDGLVVLLVSTNTTIVQQIITVFTNT